MLLLLNLFTSQFSSQVSRHKSSTNNNKNIFDESNDKYPIEKETRSSLEMTDLCLSKERKDHGKNCFQQEDSSIDNVTSPVKSTPGGTKVVWKDANQAEQREEEGVWKTRWFEAVLSGDREAIGGMLSRDASVIGLRNEVRNKTERSSCSTLIDA